MYNNEHVKKDQNGKEELLFLYFFSINKSFTSIDFIYMYLFVITKITGTAVFYFIIFLLFMIRIAVNSNSATTITYKI